jgi:hypothetical protein
VFIRVHLWLLAYNSSHATKTELLWDGKQDAKGQRVAPLRFALPFQTVEMVNESAQERAMNLFQRAAQEQPWRNRLSWGNKKYVLPSRQDPGRGRLAGNKCRRQ